MPSWGQYVMIWTGKLRFPDVRDRRYREIGGTLEQMQAAGVPILIHGKVRARELFGKIVKQASSQW